jgi:hypothetical protein
VPTSEPEPLPAVEPPVNSLGRVARERGGARLVSLSVEHAERSAGGVEIFRVQRERFGDAQPAAEEDCQQGAVADAGRRAPRAGGAERLHVGERQGLGRESAGGFSLHTHQTVLGTIQRACLARLDSAGRRAVVTAGDLAIERGFIGGGYGAPTPAGDAAIRLAEQHEGIALEHTYTAKCLAALLHHGTTAEFRGRPLLFWNTFSSVEPEVAPSPPDSLPPPFRRFF